MYASATGVKAMPVDGVFVGVFVKMDVDVDVGVGKAPLNSRVTVAVVAA
jgi:hypothetical protein